MGCIPGVPSANLFTEGLAGFRGAAASISASQSREVPESRGDSSPREGKARRALGVGTIAANYAKGGVYPEEPCVTV